LSVHGANRLGANSLLDTLVFGRRAGREAARYARETSAAGGGEALLASEQARIGALLERPAHGETYARLRLELGTTMDRYLAVVRDERGLRAAFETIVALRARYARVSVGDKGRVYNQALTFVLELGYMLDCAEATVRSALTRTESRGAHYRSDFPERDDERWLKHVLVTDGEEEAEYLPVTITRWKPEVRAY
jgi:succinate dehydrogenase / fumarate reductase flavoprotein subunit